MDAERRIAGGVVIKQQHNIAGNGKDYPLRLPRIMHEYVLFCGRGDAWS
jgi:hypothetical protein